MATKYIKWPQNIPNNHNIDQITTKYTKLPQNIPNYHKIYQDQKNIPKDFKCIIKWSYNIPTFSFPGAPKYTQIGITYVPSGNPVEKMSFKNTKSTLLKGSVWRLIINHLLII
jgi:hypothetical protein